MIIDDYYSYKRKSLFRLYILAGFVPILVLQLILFSGSLLYVDIVLVVLTLLSLYIPSKLFYAYKVKGGALYIPSGKVLDLTQIRSVIIENRRIEGKIYMGDIIIYTVEGKRVTLPKVLNPDIISSVLSSERTPNNKGT
ncbi:hypothetical protein [Stygiolobus caldivivus]|uniref:PH domain-containing protein n=1 Tax=Stygiolobus caldivivus TaxID=2824673 RepID=A0A8D5ZFM5_9CREN|nr:hypothetical protein [Stygiolobus caldivivus]BCU70348.1 hypothetical protein KN1_16450 [Stygiolobus caldivivus]